MNVFRNLYFRSHYIVNANSDVFMVKCYSKSTSIRWFSCFSDRNYNSVYPKNSVAIYYNMYKNCDDLLYADKYSYCIS
jgi:hypothetical protein